MGGGEFAINGRMEIELLNVTELPFESGSTSFAELSRP